MGGYGNGTKTLLTFVGIPLGSHILQYVIISCSLPRKAFYHNPHHPNWSTFDCPLTCSKYHPVKKGLPLLADRNLSDKHIYPGMSFSIDFCFCFHHILSPCLAYELLESQSLTQSSDLFPFLLSSSTNVRHGLS